jgi:hypothetical protein
MDEKLFVAKKGVSITPVSLWGLETAASRVAKLWADYCRIKKLSSLL